MLYWVQLVCVCIYFYNNTLLIHWQQILMNDSFVHCCLQFQI
jgi:hypothetical protein